MPIVPHGTISSGRRGLPGIDEMLAMAASIGSITTEAHRGVSMPTTFRVKTTSGRTKVFASQRPSQAGLP